MRLTESDIEIATLDWLAGLGWTVAHGPDLAPEGKAPERASYGDVLLLGRLRKALAAINRNCPLMRLMMSCVKSWRLRCRP
jgi:type I restriction enzyme R subunit